MAQPISYLGLVWGERSSRIKEELAKRYELVAESEASLSFRGEVAQEPAEIEARFAGGLLDEVIIRIDVTGREIRLAEKLFGSLLEIYEHRHGASISSAHVDPAGIKDAHGEWRDAQACLRLDTVTDAGCRFIVIAYARNEA